MSAAIDALEAALASAIRNRDETETDNRQTIDDGKRAQRVLDATEQEVSELSQALEDLQAADSARGLTS